MGKINASLSTVSTEFEPLPPAIYDFEIEKIEEVKKNGKDVNAYVIANKVISADQHGRVFRDYVTMIDKKGNRNEMGEKSMKRYFETCFGIDEVSGPKQADGSRKGGWTDDEFDTDKLKGQRWRGQLDVKSHTPEGETVARLNNRIVEMDSYR